MPNLAAAILVAGALVLLSLLIARCCKPSHLTPEQAHHEAGLRGGQ